MLNYISAEWYKLRHTKGIFIAFGFLLLLISCFFVPAFWVESPTFEVYAGAYVVTLILGFFLAPVFAIRAFDDQYGRGTMKNEVVFGIPRYRIYLGKLIFGGMVGSVAAFLVLGVYLLLCFLTGGMADENAWLCVELCIQATLHVLPLWLSSLSLAFLLQVVVKSSGGAVAVNYLILLFTVPIAMVGGPEEPTSSFFMTFMSRWFFVAPFRGIYMSGAEFGILPNMAYSWLVGLGWILVASALGMLVFSRKEIN